MTRRVIVVLLVVLVVLGAIGYSAAAPFRERFLANRECCAIPLSRNVGVTLAELRGERAYAGEIGQDKWVLETMFPDVTDGFFVDVGSGHGTIGSNTVMLERRGWKGICIDPFPVHMEGRTCQMFKEVVFSEAGRAMTFRAAKGLAGLEETLGRWNTTAMQAPKVQFTTTTLDNILTRGGAPPFVHFVSLDIEGAEYEALKGFPFDRVRVGAWVIEHNFEEPKRSNIERLLVSHGYVRSHSFKQDDFYASKALPPSAEAPRRAGG
jgi:FkbM family methyltransferase